ncbi:archaeal fructose-1,6-bisphosphatase [Rubidibacter lacunae KORDI 51-2]|uniref:Archaeal fructose-1,6-bisphosphatase n=1 Tax=Rubidibacter lacunae KORDI 51-2 TaxID=582515 RepID=U5DNJ1_9CHRO|nr:inositol monophosphatase family protein [Rubidibacter lacunae]ERN41275.1 archaeal fructose-1,6-bisphosphatase [Rubidibacter lacunae KORDI 51-2]
MKTEEYRAFIRVLAERSGDAIAPYFARHDLTVELKADRSPVTKADREGEAVMRELIGKTYPHHGIIGEEYGSENSSAEYVWTLDPIDGTVSFSRGCPLFGTAIGLLHRGTPILGAIHNPILKQFCIGDGEQTTVNDRVALMRPARSLEQAMLSVTDLKNIYKHHERQGFEKLLQATGLFRTWGDCYGYIFLVKGGVDIMLDPIMNPWDVLPLIPILRGAGGIVTDWSGADPVRSNSCVAACANIHDRIVQLLNS